MKPTLVCGVALAALLLAVPVATPQGPRPPYQPRETWYEFLVRQFNSSDFDYGAWIEERKQAFLAATVQTPYFWYSLVVTALLLFVLLAYTKLHLDHRRSMWVTAEMMADLYNHDLHSREVAKEAIEKYNAHIEQCNRAIEAGDSTDGRPGWGDTESSGLRAELQRVAAQLEATTQDRNKLQEELAQKALVVADLSMRLDALSKKVTGSSDRGAATSANTSPDRSGDGSKFVGHINRLQEELYAERQKNKRLKGA
ncbi:MAG: hypothetical protein L0387_02165 [Acidobacteria bacterium]|nr:hypothetical protein [Acidobacteriota bacterium]